MNSKHLTSTSFFKNFIEFKHVFDKFGPSAGRYILSYPYNYISKIYTHNKELLLENHIDDYDFKKISELLIKLKNDGVFIDSSLPFIEEKSLLENIELFVIPKHAKSIIVENSNRKICPKKYMDYLSDLDMEATDSEIIKNSIDNFMRVTENIRNCEHFKIIDPFFDLSNQNVLNIFSHLVSNSTNNKTIRRIEIWTKIISNDSHIGVNKLISDALQNIDYSPDANITVIFNLCRDGYKLRMHDRFVFSKKGGLQLSNSLSNKQADVVVNPLSSKVFKEIETTYSLTNLANYGIETVSFRVVNGVVHKTM